MAYNILPVLLAITALVISGHYKPEFTWKTALISIKGDPSLYEVSQTDVTGLGEEPFVTVTEKSTGYGCFIFGRKISYVQNILLERKESIKRNIEATSTFLGFTLLSAFFDFIVLATCLLITGKIRLRLETFLGIFLVGLVIIGILMVSGPITGGPHVMCIVEELSIQAELIEISTEGSSYMLLGKIVATIAWFFVFTRYAFYRDMIFTPQQVQPSNN